MPANILDVARTAYVRLPFPVRSTLAPLMARLPSSLKLGSTYQRWRGQIARSDCDPEFCLQWQRNALDKLIVSALSHSPYYRSHLAPLLGQAPSREDIAKAWRGVPIIDREIVAAERERMCIVSPSSLDMASTGGSSGRPLSFFIDKARSPVEFAFVMHAWSQLGKGEDDWHATFRGFEIPDLEKQPFEVESSLKELRLSVFHMSDRLMTRYLSEIMTRGIRYLKGYPCALGALAGHAIEAGLVDENIKGILLHSEPLHDIYRQRLQRAFPNAVIRSFYGLSEKCAFATECEEPGHYEFSPLYGLTELLDAEDRPVETPGQRGRLVATGLLFPGMPFIRYDTRDEATLVALPSRDNCYRLRVADIRPRSDGEMLVTRSRYVIEANSLFMMGDELDAVTELQFEQSEAGTVELKCVMYPGAKLDGVMRFARMVKDKSRGELEMRVRTVEKIETSTRGKRPLTIQRLDVSAYPRLSRAEPVI